MLMTCKKNILFPIHRIVLLIQVFLFFPLALKAQEGEKDTVVTDTSVVEEVFVEDTDDENTTDKKYFFKRLDTLLVNQRSLPEDAVKKMKEDEDFWYADGNLKKSRSQAVDERENGKKGKKGSREQGIQEEEKTYVPLGLRPWFQTLLWLIIIGGFTTFLIIYLSSSNVGLFRKRNRRTDIGETEEPVMGDIFAINYQKEIDKAAAQGNYRMAIRLMFLRVLKNMSEKNIIRYKQDKTNLDYLLEVHSTSYYNNFFRVTRNYEYSWYGLFPVSESAYKLIRGDFDQFDKELR